MTDRSFSRSSRYLQGAACLVVILWGIREASEILVPILLSLLLAFGFLPLPNWLTGKLHLRGGTAGAILAVPLTLAVKKFVEKLGSEEWN